MKKNIGKISLLVMVGGAAQVYAPVYISPERLQQIEAAQEKATQAEEKVAVVFPNFHDQCVLLEINFPFLRGNKNWNKVKSFLSTHAGKKYHRNPADRNMLVNLWIGIENRETRDQQIAAMNSKEWNSFWQAVLDAAFKNVNL